MKEVVFKGSMTSAYGKDLEKAIAFSGSFKAYESISEVRDAKEDLTDEEIVTVVNNRRKASAVQASRNSALEAAGIQKPTNEDPAVALSNMVKILVAQGKSQDEALTLAKTILS